MGRAEWPDVGGKELDETEADGDAEECEQPDTACQSHTGLNPSPPVKRLMQSGGVVIDGCCHYTAGALKFCHYRIKLSSKRPELK